MESSRRGSIDTLLMATALDKPEKGEIETELDEREREI